MLWGRGKWKRKIWQFQRPPGSQSIAQIPLHSILTKRWICQVKMASDTDLHVPIGKGNVKSTGEMLPVVLMWKAPLKADMFVFDFFYPTHLVPTWVLISPTTHLPTHKVLPYRAHRAEHSGQHGRGAAGVGSEPQASTATGEPPRREPGRGRECGSRDVPAATADDDGRRAGERSRWRPRWTGSSQRCRRYQGESAIFL